MINERKLRDRSVVVIGIRDGVKTMALVSEIVPKSRTPKHPTQEDDAECCAYEECRPFDKKGIVLTLLARPGARAHTTASLNTSGHAERRSSLGVALAGSGRRKGIGGSRAQLGLHRKGCKSLKQPIAPGKPGCTCMTRGLPAQRSPGRPECVISQT
jgi:hypothetical protein